MATDSLDLVARIERAREYADRHGCIPLGELIINQWANGRSFMILPGSTHTDAIRRILRGEEPNG